MGKIKELSSQIEQLEQDLTTTKQKIKHIEKELKQIKQKLTNTHKKILTTNEIKQLQNKPIT